MAGASKIIVRIAGVLAMALSVHQAAAQDVSSLSFSEVVFGARNAQRANDCGRFEIFLNELRRRAKTNDDGASAANIEAGKLGNEGCGGRVYAERRGPSSRFDSFPHSSIFSNEIWHDGGGYAPGQIDLPAGIFAVGGISGEVTNLPSRGFFGYERGGVDRLGGFRVDEKLDRLQFGAGLNFPAFGNGTYNRVYVTFAKGEAASSGSFAPPAGSRTLIPGSAGRASGVSLGGAPAIEGIRWTWDQTDIALIWQHGFRRNLGGGFSAGAHVKAGYGFTDVQESVTGNIPLFESDIRQWSEVQTHQLPVQGGVDFSQQIPLTGDQTLRVYGYAKAGATFLRGTGSHHTQWTGFIGGFVDNSSANLSESDVRFTYRLGGGVDLVRNQYVSVGAGAWYAQRPLPVVELNGIDPASLRYEDVNEYGFNLKVRVKLE